MRIIIIFIIEMYLIDLIPRSLTQLAYTGLLAYTLLQMKLIFAPGLTWASLDACLMNADEAHCGKPQNWFKRPEDPNNYVTLKREQ